MAHASQPARHISFTRAELKAFTGATLPDLIAEGVRLLFVGINPGLRSVAVQGHFAPRGNRFYPALLRAGITDHLIDASAGLTPRDRDYLLGRGVGITSLVARATASADELGPAELAEGARALAGNVRRFRPRVVAILGVTAYRTAFGYPRAVLGRQQKDLYGAQLWVVPNPSGRNAHAPLAALAAAYREVALAAAIDLSPECPLASGRPGVRPPAPPPPAPDPGERRYRGRPPPVGLVFHGQGLRRPDGRPRPPRLAHARQSRAAPAADERDVLPDPDQPPSQAEPSSTRRHPTRLSRAPERRQGCSSTAYRRTWTCRPPGRERMTSTQHVRVEGTSYQRGQQYGTQARSRVRLSVQAYRQAFAHFAAWDWATVRREAARFEAPIGKFRPGYLEEMRGIADGAGLDLTDVLAINVRTEVMYSAKARNAPRAVPSAEKQAPAECSAFAQVPGPGQAGPTIIGQNWDWLLHAARTLVVLEVRQPDGPDFVTVVEAGLLAKTGMNAAGLGLVTNALVTDADVGEPGLPYHVLLRAVLDCTTVTDALQVLQAGPRSSSANYLIAHAGGAALDIEAAPGDFSRLYPVYPEDGVLRHTNHFLAGIHPADLALWAMPSSAVRLQRLRAAGTTRTLDDFGVLLADHADYPHGICAHPDPAAHPCEQGATIASVLMDLTARRIWLAAGNPCQAPYEQLDITL